MTLIINSELIEIKKTKSVEMSGNTEGVGVNVNDYNLWIPARLVFQVKRGLESWTQRFYRKHTKK